MPRWAGGLEDYFAQKTICDSEPNNLANYTTSISMVNLCLYLPLVELAAILKVQAQEAQTRGVR